MPKMIILRVLRGFPHKELNDKSNDLRFFKFATNEGMSLDIALCDRLGACNALKFMSSFGIGPPKWLDEKFIDVEAII